ncbi:SDR family oxidoreductase [Shumkonia mesophila]|uniref:SDR family oxidoreductase n=1 Tax=Shumkonia mesophila TaxID=2838854 RepID=UPI002935001F|nr:SDR family oxidoreductase [Shumkonia mesophila]
MSGRLAGKTIFATASGQGIGRATALAFAREGAHVWATDINEKSLATLAAENPAIKTRRLDVTDPAAIAAIAAELGAVDVVFNAAGYVANGTILECDEKDWDLSFDLNVKSMYRVIRAFLPAMIAAGGGAIVNISSVASAITGVPNRFVYGTTKAAVTGLTKMIARDFVGNGIRCNAVCPGTIDSPSLNERMAAGGNYEAVRASFMERQPMKRLGTPEEVAMLAVYLASDEAAFATGQTWTLDGGWTM